MIEAWVEFCVQDHPVLLPVSLHDTENCAIQTYPQPMAFKRPAFTCFKWQKSFGKIIEMKPMKT